MEKTVTQQREVFYSGAVQGVGFRYTARSIARGFSVSGFVKNLRDGRVQVVVEGPVDQVQGFLNALRTELGHHIARAEETVLPASGRFSGFEIRF